MITCIFCTFWYHCSCAVLGERDSGKSMLLSCLVGGSEIDKGHIWVLGGKPRTKSSKTLTKFVGYMPQVFLYFYNRCVLRPIEYKSNIFDYFRSAKCPWVKCCPLCIYIFNRIALIFQVFSTKYFYLRL